MTTLKKPVLDEELSQSKARVAMSQVSLFVFLAIGKLTNHNYSETINDSLMTIVSYLAFSVGWFFIVKKLPNRWPARRYLSMVADLAIMTFFFHIGGKSSAVVFPIFLWIIIGNGIRFGERFLITAIALGTVGFSTILIWAPFWKSNLQLSGGLMVGVIVLPLFFFSVLKRLKTVTRLEIELDRSRLADKAKDDFLATMSHELRTPMNGVLGMAEALRDSKLDKNQKEQLHIITRSVDSLLKIINDILDYSKIAAKNLTLENETFDLKQTLTDVMILMETAAGEKGLSLEFDYPDDLRRHFKGDAVRVRQIAFNLMGNAIKFTKRGYVKMSCSMEEKEAGTMVTMSVKDTGIGIPETHQAAIFGHFEQVDTSTTRQYDGAGLGLAISRQLARMMDGDILVKSKEGQGSKFSVQMCLESCAPPKILPQKPSSTVILENTDFGYKALVVEDNKFNQVVVINMLKKIGISCEVAENGQQAVDMIDQSEFDLVFMDVRMPVMNGYEATQTIRARKDGLADIPILAITGEATKQDVAKCLNAGMNTHLSKPVRLAMLVESIKSLSIKTPIASG
ncbi:MAG: response regulator [bacterium]|nr:response regulator [bacterium]